MANITEEKEEKKIKVNRQKGKAINVLSSSQLLGTLVVLFLLIAFIVFIFTARFQNYFERIGILYADGQVREVHEPYNGIITEYVAKVDSYVKKGDTLVKIYIDDIDGDGEVDVLKSGDIMKKNSIIVKSPYNGYVLQHNKKPWQKVSIEDSLLTIAENNNEMISTVISFVRTNDLNALKIGQKARVLIDGINEEEYGFVSGNVVEIGEKNLSNEDIHTLLGSDTLDFTNILKEDNVYAVKIKLDTKGGKLCFTTGKNPDTKIKINGPCSVQYVIYDIKPYEMIYKNAKDLTND